MWYMVCLDEIYARFDQKTNVVTFEEDPEQYNTRDMVLTLDSKINEISQLSQQLREVHYNTVTSKRYTTTQHDITFLFLSISISLFVSISQLNIRFVLNAWYI